MAPAMAINQFWDETPLTIMSTSLYIPYPDTMETIAPKAAPISLPNMNIPPNFSHTMLVYDQ